MPLDDDGFLDGNVPVQASLRNAQPGDLISVPAAAHARALLLLGEPGLGKSTALRSIVGHLEARDVGVTWVDGANLADETFADELGTDFDRLVGSDAPRPASRSRAVVIDALDESAMVRRLPRRLGEALLAKDLSSLQLIIGCRTADVPVDLLDILEQLFGDSMVVADLAPLRRSDAVVLANSLGVPGEDVVSAAVARGAGSLAAIPLTLALLVQEYVERGTLDVSARELFERGILTLLDVSIEPGPAAGWSTVDQRRAIAERIAAVMLLSGKRTVFVGRALDAGKQDLRDGDVTGGTERTAGGAFNVTPELVRATLGTALFGGRGPDRLAFVHASQAAFLAACHLRRREPSVPRRQLEGLLLVAAPDGSRTVPVPLRELGAWLSSLDPLVGAWLPETDPESMIGHESYLESDDLRSAVVRALLTRAAEFELGDRYWTRGINLAYPGLAAQLLEVLEEFDSQPPAWSDFARCRVALRLARYASSPLLTQRLLQIAESAEWNAHLGCLSVEAVLAQDADATPRLIQLLRSLDDPEYARGRDRDDELRGHLLDGLWPEHVDVTEVLPSLRPRQSMFFGSYWLFLRRLPQQLNEGQLATVLDWAAAAAHKDVPVTGGTDDEDGLPEERPIGALDPMLAEDLVERALGSRDPAPFIANAAMLTWPRLDRFDHPTLPRPLDEGATGGATMALRRSFAEALLRQRAPTARERLDVWHLLHGWRAARPAEPDIETHGRTSMLDAADFAWAVERANEFDGTSPPLAMVFAEVAGYLFNPFDVQVVEVASRQRDSIVWSQLRHWFDPIDLQSELAHRLREQHGWTRAEQPDEVEAGQALRVDLVTKYAALAAGEWTAFWRVAWLLQFDPETARGPRRFNDDLLSFPAMSALPREAPTQLLTSARDFLVNESDHAEEWLGTSTYDLRAWAGYLSLVMLEAAGELDSLSRESVGRWTGAVLWFWSVPSETADADRKRRLVRRAAEADAARLADLLVRYVRGELHRGASASEVEAFDAPSVRAVHATWVGLVEELHDSLLAGAIERTSASNDNDRVAGFSSDEEHATARYTWQRMFHGLAVADAPTAEALASLWASAADSPAARGLAAAAIAVLVTANAAAWRRLVDVVVADDELGRLVAAAIGDDHHDVGLLAEFDERELGAFYQWLANVYPPEQDTPDELGSSWTTPEARARRWRDGVLTALANRGTDDAVRVLFDLHTQVPSRVVVLSNLVRARVAAFATAWTPPTPAEVQALLEDARRRLVRSAEELGLLIREALEAVEVDFIRTGQLLWDRQARTDEGLRPWVPKPEAALSAFLAHDLQLRLHDRGVAVWREVLVKPTDEYGAGNRPDILVEAIARDDSVASPSVHRVAIEVKGAWNRDVLVAQRDQLALRYLPEAGTGVGLYVVGWYPTELWDEADYRRRRVATPTAEELLSALATQAEAINNVHGLLVTPVVLVVSRPTPLGEQDVG